MASERGAFGGELEILDGSTFERAPPAVLECLAPHDGPPAIVRAAGEPGRAAIAPFVADRERGVIAYDADLGALESLPQSGMPRPQLFVALADVAAALHLLHAAGHVHSAIRPEMLRVDASGAATLLIPAHAVGAHALHVASVKSDAIDLAASAFLAPELLVRGPASVATDTYALAACAYHALTGDLPVGQIDVRRAAMGAPDWAITALYQSLLAVPAARPRLGALERALRAVAEAFVAPIVVRAHEPAPAPPPRSEASTVLVLVLIVGGIFVLTGALWLVAITWDSLGEAGHLTLLLLLSVGGLGASESCRKQKLERASLALTTIGTQLFWADGTYFLVVLTKNTGLGAWTALAGFVATVTLAFAFLRRSALVASVAAIDFAIAAACLAAYLESGNPLGPALYAMCIAGAYAAIAASGEATVGRAIGGPFAGGAVLAGLVSALCAVVLLVTNGDHHLFATVWPYVVMGVLTLPWLAPIRAPYGELGAVAALLLLAATPTIEALIQHDDPFYLVVAIGIGTIVATAAFVAPRFSKDPALQVTMTSVGIASVIGGPGFFALAHLDDDKSTTYLTLALAVGASLVLLSYMLSARAATKVAYRALESAGLLLFFGFLTIDSIAHLDSWVYPGILFLGGVVMLGVGMATKRAAPVFATATALVVNMWLQYFVKLKDHVPVSLLCVGFGLALLVGGVGFERKMRALLPTIREWA